MAAGVAVPLPGDGMADRPAAPAAPQVGTVDRHQEALRVAGRMADLPVDLPVVDHRVGVVDRMAAAVAFSFIRSDYLLLKPAVPKPRLPCWVRGIAPG